jgi:hypothetical protein
MCQYIDLNEITETKLNMHTILRVYSRFQKRNGAVKATQLNTNETFMEAQCHNAGLKK